MVTLTANDKTSVSFSSLRGQDVIYNVIVWDPLLNTSAAYVPAHTYACSFDAVEDNCSSLGEYIDFNFEQSSLALQSISTNTELKNIKKFIFQVFICSIIQQMPASLHSQF